MKNEEPGYYGKLFSRLNILLASQWQSRRYLEVIFYAVVYLPLHFIMRLMFKLDGLVYKDLKNIEVKEPIIVIGHPRSGTTSLQSYIAQTGKVAFSTFQALLFPSVILLKNFTPIIRFFTRFDVLDSEKKGHKIELDTIEEDEGLFLHSLNSEILTVFSPWLLVNRKTRKAGLRAGLSDLNDDESDMPFLKEYAKRRMLVQQKDRVLLKSNPSVLRIKKMLKYFPDAKFIFIYRDPVETIPSFLSLHYQFIKKRLNDRDLKTYISQKYRYSFSLYHYFERIRGKMPAEQLLTVEFEELKSDPASLMRKISAYTELDLPEEYYAELMQKKGRKHKKSHRNIDPGMLGISIENIKKDFALIRTRYDRKQYS